MDCRGNTLFSQGRRKMQEKKHWETPKLIILGRGKPEENVLAGCKSHPHPIGPGPSNCDNDFLVCLTELIS